MLRDGLEILRAYLGSKLYVCRKLDLERMAEEVLGELLGKKFFQ